MGAPVSTSEETLQQAVERVWETIPPLWNQMRANVRGIASERYHISVQQFRILRHIGRGVRLASELAAAIQTSRPAISQSLDTLVEKGLITRRQSAHDRRCAELELTPSGAGMLDAIFQENRRWMMHRLASLSAEEISHILLSMRVLKDAFVE